MKTNQTLLVIFFLLSVSKIGFAQANNQIKLDLEKKEANATTAIDLKQPIKLQLTKCNGLAQIKIKFLAPPKDPIALSHPCTDGGSWDIEDIKGYI